MVRKQIIYSEQTRVNIYVVCRPSRDRRATIVLSIIVLRCARIPVYEALKGIYPEVRPGERQTVLQSFTIRYQIGRQKSS